MEEKILQKYQEGSDVGYIIEKLNISPKLVKQTLLTFKEANRLKKSFTDEFKQVIAERDMNGVSRRQIAQELEINANTVKKACELFGQTHKEKATSENEYTKIEGEFPLDVCPSCSSDSVNLVDDNTTYCKKCGNEHIHLVDHALKVNWEYVE
jgi:transcription initiation factor TFIIIB Brf1 subunit/transcription initiation factor TFIIB